MFKVQLTPRRWQQVESLAAASKAVRKHIEANDIGSSRWNGGEVRDADGEIVARVSYNGRVWAPGYRGLGFGRELRVQS